MPLKLALAVRGTVAGHRLGTPRGTEGTPPHFQCKVLRDREKVSLWRRLFASRP